VSDAEFARLRELAEEHGQGHIFRWWDDLDATWREYLLGQVAALDFGELDQLIRDHVLSGESPEEGELVPAEALSLPESSEGDAVRRRAIAIGEDAVRSGHVAALVVAGGLGTRLKYVPPKGTYPTAPITGKSLFQLHAEKILAARRRYGVLIPWYVMTSEATDAPTRAFFADHDWFGLGADSVFFFEQALSPTVGSQGKTLGKLLLAEKGALAMSPNGHGGVLNALRDSGALADMARRGIRVVSYFQVDNPLVPPVDPLFLGLHVERKSEFSAKALAKRDCEEGLGAFCYSRGVLKVVEYSHLPRRYKYALRPDGRPLFLAGSPAIHAFDVAFLQRLIADGVSLPYHRADKKVKCLDDAGQRVDPATPNGVRFEKFIFDALPYARNTLVLMADRTEEFAPIKNKEGEDSPATARQAQINLFGRWLEAAGVEVPWDEGNATVPIEISPLYALDAEELKRKLPPGIRLNGPLNLQP